MVEKRDKVVKKEKPRVDKVGEANISEKTKTPESKPSTLYAVVRIRGSVNTRRSTRDTLKLLRLTRANHCVIVPKNESYDGMLRKVRHMITWGEIDDDTLHKLISQRGRKPGDKRLEKRDVDEAFSSLKGGERPKSIKPVFRLNPPSHGFKSVKLPYPKGVFGYRKSEINELIKRMV